MTRDRWFMFLEYVKPHEGDVSDKSLHASGYYREEGLKET